MFFRGRHKSGAAGVSSLLRRVRADGGWDVYAVKLGLIAGAYYGSAKLGLALAFETPSVTAICPPTGIALAALVLWGYRVWPGVALGAELGCRSIAFPSISTGIFGFPLEKAAPIAVCAVRDGLARCPSIQLVRFCLFSDEDLSAYRTALMG